MRKKSPGCFCWGGGEGAGKGEGGELRLGWGRNGPGAVLGSALPAWDPAGIPGSAPLPLGWSGKGPSWSSLLQGQAMPCPNFGNFPAHPAQCKDIFCSMELLVASLSSPRSSFLSRKAGAVFVLLSQNPQWAKSEQGRGKRRGEIWDQSVPRVTLTPINAPG